MGPTRNQHSNPRQSVIYDMNNPINWTVTKIREELMKRGITAPTTSRKSELLRLYRTSNDSTGRLTEQPITERREIEPESRNVNNKDGGDVAIILQELAKLRNEINDNKCAQIQQVTKAMNVSTSSVTPSSTAAATSNTLSTAYGTFNGTTTSPYISNSHNHVRTKYGFSLESLPYIETVQPKLRQSIVEDDKVSATSTRGLCETNTLCSAAPAYDGLKEDVEHLWDAAISPQTAKTYKTAIDHFLCFVALSNIVIEDTLPCISEDLLIQFVTYCYKALFLSYSTIRLYLAGIRYHYLRAGYKNPLMNMQRLECILRGVKRSQSLSTCNINVHKCFPITFAILYKITKLLEAGVFSCYTDKMMLAVCQMAFFAFLRCGEFTARNKTDTNDCILFNDVSFAQDHSSYTLNLRKSKTDPFRSGVQIQVFNVPPLYPVTSMIQFRQMRSSNVLLPESPMFVDFNGEILYRENFIGMLRHMLRLLNLDDQKYCGHSFRIGAATSAAAAGIEDHLIQTLGRWSSNCYSRYIRTSSNVLQEAQGKLSSCFK